MTHSAKQKFDIRNLVVSCLVAMAAALSGCGEKPESEFQQIVRQSNCVTAKQVYSDYQNNEVAAQQKYQGKMNRICGIVKWIELNLMDEPIVSLGASFLGSVSIGGVDTASAARLSKGSVAVFECNEINELLGTPVLTEYRMVPTQNVPTEAVSDAGRAVPNETASDAGALPNTIPARYQGRWTKDTSRCSTRYDDGKVEVYSDAIKFWESEGEVIKIQVAGGKIVIQLSMAGEGERWTSEYELQETLTPNKILLDGRPLYRCI